MDAETYKSMVIKIMDFTLSRSAFLKGERFFSILQEFTGEQQIHSSKITFTAFSQIVMRKDHR